MSSTKRTEIPDTIAVADSMNGKVELARTYLGRLRMIRSQLDMVESLLADAVQAKATWSTCSDLAHVTDLLGAIIEHVCDE